MALSTGFRCVIMISLPTLTTDRGRTAIYSFIFALLLTGPVANISANLYLISKTMACSADLARNQSTALKKQLQDPVNKIKDKMDGVASTLSAVGDTLTTAFSPIYSGIEAATAGLDAAAGGLKEASYACKKMFTGAYASCTEGINGAYTKCRSTLDRIPVVGKRDLTRVKERISRHKEFVAVLEKVKEEYMKIREKFGKETALEMIETLDIDFGYDVNNLLKDILSNVTSYHDHRSKRGLSEVCNVLNVGAICNVLKVGSGICKPVEVADSLVSAAAKKTNEAFQTVKNWFNVKVYKSQGVKGQVNASKTAAQIQKQIQEQLTADTSLVVDNLAILGNLLAVLLLFLIIQSAMYLRKYISKDEFDNMYITKQFREYDTECWNSGKDTVLPLKKAEKKMYIDCSSCLLTAVEFKTSFGCLTQLFLHMIVCTILVFFDYVFYYVVYLVQRYGNIEIDLAGSSSIVLTVEGKGEIAQLLRTLISDINIKNTYNADLNFTTCLPVALLPDTSNIIIYITLYVISLCTIIIQAYGMRMRRRISAYFYPLQETERIIYLHKKIIFKRQGRQKFQVKHMTTRRKERDISQSIALTHRVADKVPAMSSILGVNQRECLNPSSSSKKKFDHHVVFEHNLEKVQNVVHQLFRTDKEENLHLKAGFGVLAGIFGGGILYLMLYFLYKIPALVCLYIVLPCTIILCLGMALSTGFRCVVMISLPTLSTGRGRTAIYSLIFALLLTGHKKIIFKRQGRQKFQFMHMKTRKKERDTSQSLALTRKVANKVPAMTTILRVNQRECLSLYMYI